MWEECRVRSTLEFGLIVLSVLFAFYLGASLADQPNDNVNAAQMLNLTNETINATLNETINAAKDVPSGAGAPSNITNVTKNDAGRSINDLNVIASDDIPEVHPPKRATFIIADVDTPMRNASKVDQSTLNAIALKLAVDGTPHGYLTYYG
jgi:hypothetical protein